MRWATWEWWRRSGGQGEGEEAEWEEWEEERRCDLVATQSDVGSVYQWGSLVCPATTLYFPFLEEEEEKEET